MVYLLKAVFAFLWISVWLPTLTWAHGEDNELHSVHTIDYRLLKDGDVQVHEQIDLQGQQGSTNLTRSFWLTEAPGAWPLLQSIEDISVSDNDGQAVPYRYREYEVRANIDILRWPKTGTLHLRYRIHRALDLRSPTTTWSWTISGHQWSPIVDSVQLRLSHPGEPEKVGFVAVVGYSDDDTRHPSFTRQGDVFVLAFNPASESTQPVSFSVAIPSAGLGPVPPSWLLHDLIFLFRIPLIVLGIILVLALLQLFLLPSLVVKITRLSNFAPVVPAMIAAYWATHYWIFEAGHRSAGNDLSGEFIVNFGLAGFTLLFAVKQYRLLGQAKRVAYFAQLSFPTVLLVAWPIAFVDRSLLILPLLSLPIYIYWLRSKIALEFGVGAHRIAEEVAIVGELSAIELAKKMGLSTQRMLVILEENSSLPLVIDHKNGVVMSAEIAAMRKEFQVCNHCGGGTEICGMGQLKCGHCDREYASEEMSKGIAPLPVVVESLAIFVESLRDGIYFFALVISAAIFFMEAVAGSIVGGLIGGAIAAALLVLPGLGVGVFPSRLRKGKSLGLARWLMLLLAPLILPIFVWFRLRSRRVQIFASELSTHEIESSLGVGGEWSLAELSEYLQCSQEDAVELASYLCANQLIDAVYDRRHGRLVSRALYRKIAKEGDCKNCGGFFGVIGGQAICHYCGSTAADRP